MSAPWPQTYGFHINSLSNPYRRMMNTSGIAFKDHAGSLVCFIIPFFLPCLNIHRLPDSNYNQHKR